ncbi:MAG: hypothetical protein K9W44_07895 [Candidatus Lokiarchaeota archaeon]|nr:hypothetical protein [Candidatus Harpocratesius repetitus]
MNSNFSFTNQEIKNKNNLSTQSIFTKFVIDKAEQIDLIEYIEYAILDFTSEEIESISEKKAEKLKNIATRILKKITQNLGIFLEE